MSSMQRITPEPGRGSSGEEHVADYVVIGAGSAGCVVASRLAAAGARVILLEAGPRDTSWLVRIPAGALHLRGHPVLDWRFVTDPAADAAGRIFHWPRGRVLGGSSSINGMNFVRGVPSDFDYWAQSGCQGWSFADVLPHFRAIERTDDGDDAVRGRAGPIRVKGYDTILDLTHTYVRAATEAGFPLFADINDREGEGVGYSQMSRTGRFRASAAHFLAEPAARANLAVQTDAQATGLVFDGARCTGVAYMRGGRACTARARREVILAAGAIGSPHLLQVSGIGPAAELRRIGVAVRHDLPGVGANLSDHYAATVSQRTQGILTLNQIARGPRVALAMAEWLLRGTGPLTFGATTASVFARSREGLEYPDIQLLFLPGSYHPRAGASRRQLGQLEPQPGMRVSVCCLHPQSRGSVVARSADAREPPAITPGYLTAQADMDVITAGIRIARRIFAQPALAPYSVAEVLPGGDVQSGAELADYIRRAGHTAFHPVGTCRMGQDAMAVVDPRLRVHGVAGLRVIDASIMPSLTSGNTNAPTMMIGEKGASMMIEDMRDAA